MSTSSGTHGSKSRWLCSDFLALSIRSKRLFSAKKSIVFRLTGVINQMTLIAVSHDLNAIFDRVQINAIQFFFFFHADVLTFEIGIAA